MAKQYFRDILQRWEGNPILRLEDIPFPASTVFNAGAAKLGDDYLLLLRVEDLSGRSVFALAHSENGYAFEVEPEPVMVSATEEPFRTYERRGIEDPRITFMDGEFYVMYTAVSRYGALLALAKTKDFHNFERVALISEPDNKDGALFPCKFGGRYARFDRPGANGGSSMWISYSDDLIHWGDARVVMSTRPGMWDSDRIGACVPPIRTEEGWLEIYHGVKSVSAGPIYRLGCAMFDLENPARLIARATTPILAPREIYERTGDVDNVVFSC